MAWGGLSPPSLTRSLYFPDRQGSSCREAWVGGSHRVSLASLKSKIIRAFSSPRPWARTTPSLFPTASRGRGLSLLHSRERNWEAPVTFQAGSFSTALFLHCSPLGLSLRIFIPAGGEAVRHRRQARKTVKLNIVVRLGVELLAPWSSTIRMLYHSRIKQVLVIARGALSQE